MHFRSIMMRAALAIACTVMTTTPAAARFWQCVPFAREVSGVEIYGNALTWWGQAESRYARGHAPEIGAVMSFRPTARMPLGHVAMVSEIVNDREVLLTHANWSRPGGTEYNVRAVDVSTQGDWSEVRVWYAPIGGLGTSVYPLNGFIYPRDPGMLAPTMAPAPSMMASNAARGDFLTQNVASGS